MGPEVRVGRLAGLLPVFLGLWLVGCGEDVPQLSRLPGDAIILAFGNSLTYGTGAGPDASYPAVLGRLIGRKVLNAGVPGELSGDGLGRLAGRLQRDAPALLLLCHGGNDLLRKRPVAELERNLRAMVDLAASRGIPVVLIGVPRPSLFLLSEADVYGRVAEDLKLPYQGEVLASILKDNSLKSDHIHPNAAGYRLLAEAIAELLRQAGAI